MILSIGSNLPTFKSVTFHPGLNVLLSTKAPGSNEGRTRNSAGKSSLIEIIHFLLGAKADPASLLRNKALAEYSFHGVFKIGGHPVRVERSGSKASRIYLDEASIVRFGFDAKADKKNGGMYITNEAWKEFLGHSFFELPATVSGSLFDESFSPSFRSMVSYFARRRGSGAFNHPEKQAEAQQRWDWQVNLSYLLGLDWRPPYELQKVRQREGQLDELKSAAKGGVLGAVVGTVAELRPQMVQARDKADRLREELARFQVHDAFESMMTEATEAKAEIQAILRQAVPLRETLDHLQDALNRERIPDRGDVVRLYEAVGIELPDAARRRFEDVERFHQSVIENRRLRLQEEVDRIIRAIEMGQQRVAALDDARGAILRTLEGHGALEDFTALQKHLADADATAASLAERFKAAEVLEGESTQLKIDRASIKRRLQEDHHARRERLDLAIRLIGAAIGGLYTDRKGNFEVEATENGPEFRISIEGDRGGGISNMEVFCLDLALFSIWKAKAKGPGFLIHDSHLFDGVDARQVAQAIQMAAKSVADGNAQYIVALNSDIFDSLSWAEDFDPAGAVLDTKLSDADESGGLFGFRFE
ncbi:MAG: DUF2326 domain-containing protein [Bosea sp.]|uniref:ABC-three component system protein n=1 Tax=Bosea sp. (in: a-proteobacteria) TaxID=1871050 RepID=UPI00238C52B9|nr:DUF2326 domain-containing protein [Bosea sp. (in: a-proteobacteria)]MCP4736849.1 DUF2326 domain-containing protein [Bosea sp. (in: a-proteobacteria)]